LGEKIDTVNEIAEALLQASRDVGLEVNRTKYMVMSRYQYHSLLITVNSLENVAQFTYLGTIVANQNSIH